jgi:hypothetical protein
MCIFKLGISIMSCLGSPFLKLLFFCVCVNFLLKIDDLSSIVYH